MIKRTYTEEVVATIRNSLPANEKIVSFLSDLFFWNKEAIYRRLRGEIAFTFEELALIADKLDFSIDNIIRLSQGERIVFDLLLPDATDGIDLYCQKREQLMAISHEISKSVSSDSLFAINYLPFSFSIFFEMLAKFDYYKWMHQTNSISSDTQLSDLIIPKCVTEMRERWLKQDRTNSAVSYILDNNVFLSLTKDIDYFYKSKLINDQELDAMRQDLILLIDALVDHARLGIATDTGARVKLYLAPMDIATNHFYIEYDDNVCCYVEVYGIDILQSNYPEAYTAQKEWIANHKKYSTLITQSGEMERFLYFDKQREYIMNMGKS